MSLLVDLFGELLPPEEREAHRNRTISEMTCHNDQPVLLVMVLVDELVLSGASVMVGS